MNTTEAATLCHDINQYGVSVHCKGSPYGSPREDDHTNYATTFSGRVTNRAELKCLRMFGYATHILKQIVADPPSFIEQYQLTALGRHVSGLKFPMVPADGFKGAANDSH